MRVPPSSHPSRPQPRKSGTTVPVDEHAVGPDPTVTWRAMNTPTLGTTLVVIAHSDGVAYVYTATALATHQLAIPLAVPTKGTYEVTAEAHWW